MSEQLVKEGAAIVSEAPGYQIVDPVALRVLYVEDRYDFQTDKKLPISPVCRIDVLVGTDQRHIDMHARRFVPPPGSKIGSGIWLFEPKGIRALSVQVEKAELVQRLRALADEIERL